MLVMIIEVFKDVPAVYDRFRQMGRMLPEGVRYINSWPTKDLKRCFQLMDCDHPSLLQEWIDKWSDLTDCEVVEVISSQAAQKIIVEGDFDEV